LFSANNKFMRVLVVEDERKTASFVRKALQAEGFAVDVMANGEGALLAAANTPFDAIILDIMLPGRDGLSVLPARMIICPNPLNSPKWSPACAHSRGAEEKTNPSFCAWRI
jgi:response regulator RpfG family c-di-GMP phosphodiesterase